MTSFCNRTLLFVLIWAGAIVAQAQNTQPFFLLNTNESGATKLYLARDYIVLKPGFRFTATPGQIFRASINSLLSFLPPLNPVPGSTTVVPGDTIPVSSNAFTNVANQGSGGVIASNDVTLRSAVANGSDTTVIKQDTSYVMPIAWFKTLPLSSNLNGYYAWQDVTENKTTLHKYNSGGAASGADYKITRDKIRTYNFNPAIDLSSDSVSKEMLIKKSNLSQTTIVGVWGSKWEDIQADKFIFAINGRRNESVLFSKSAVIPSDSAKSTLSFGITEGENFKYQATMSDTLALRKYHSEQLRIGSYYRANQPDHSVWGEEQKAVISLGSAFDTSNVNNTSKFKASLNKFPGFKGYTPELLVFDRVLSDKERSVFESYLAIKYGLTLNQSYLSAQGSVLWNNETNKAFNYRVTGYGREDALGLNQKVATTSYEEAPTFSEMASNDTYDLNDSYNMASRNRLLVMGRQPGNAMSDGSYVMWGDNNGTLDIPASTQISGFVLMNRRWLVNTNDTTKQNSVKPLEWTKSGVEVTETSFKSKIHKLNIAAIGTMVTTASMSYGDGNFSWRVGAQVGPLMVKFGTNSPALTTNSHDFGYQVMANGEVYPIQKGVVGTTRLCTFTAGQKVEVGKTGNVVYLKIDGVQYKSTEMIVTPSDLKQKFHGAISLLENSTDSTMMDLRHGGFVNTGNRIELSYATGKASGLAGFKNGKAYLIIDRSGSDSLAANNIECIPNSEYDSIRSKIIFNNVFWDKKDVFTFGYKGSNKVKGRTITPQENVEKEALESQLLVYNNRDLSSITVKVQLAHPSPTHILVLNISGRFVRQAYLSPSSSAQFMEISIPEKGVYIVKVKTNDGELTKKVVIM